MTSTPSPRPEVDENRADGAQIGNKNEKRPRVGDSGPIRRPLEIEGSVKADPDHLRQRIAECPQEGSQFRHYKGGAYVVLGAAILEGTLEPLVLYRPTEGAGSD